MSSIESFPIKCGTARFSDEAVHFDESVLGYFSSLYLEYFQSDGWWRKAAFVTYVLGLLVGARSVITAFQDGDGLFMAIILGFVILVCSVFVVRWLDARESQSPDRIRLDAIKDAYIIRGKIGLTRPRLIISYTEGESTHTHRVALPSMKTDGAAPYEQAQAAFAERGV